MSIPNLQTIARYRAPHLSAKLVAAHQPRETAQCTPSLTFSKAAGPVPKAGAYPALPNTLSLPELRRCMENPPRAPSLGSLVHQHTPTAELGLPEAS